MKAPTAILLLAIATLSGCHTISLSSAPEYQANRIVKLSAVGYGAPSSYERYADGQKRLMAMRASKLDAYRAMAEQVYGVRVTGGSTVSSLMVQNDSFRVSIDAYVRGARVTNITQMADGNYETTIEMDFDGSVVSAFIVPAPVRTIAAQSYNPVYGARGAVGPGVLYGANYYYAE